MKPCCYAHFLSAAGVIASNQATDARFDDLAEFDCRKVQASMCGDGSTLNLVEQATQLQQEILLWQRHLDTVGSLSQCAWKSCTWSSGGGFDAKIVTLHMDHLVRHIPQMRPPEQYRKLCFSSSISRASTAGDRNVWDHRVRA